MEDFLFQYAYQSRQLSLNGKQLKLNINKNVHGHKSLVCVCVCARIQYIGHNKTQMQEWKNVEGSFALMQESKHNRMTAAGWASGTVKTGQNKGWTVSQ